MSLLALGRCRKLLDPLHEIALGPVLGADRSVSAQPKFPAQHGRNLGIERRRLPGPVALRVSVLK